MHNFLVLLFAISAGMTAAGIASNLYGLLANEPNTRLGTLVHYLVMVIAGPLVLFGNSTRSYRNQECSRIAYGLALMLSLYWSFATGLFILCLALGLRGA